MNYQYSDKSQDELEAIANGLLARFHLEAEVSPDMETLAELLDLSIVPRPGLGERTTIAGFVPRRRDLVFVDAGIAQHSPKRYRLTLAEEIAHLHLEPELWSQGVPAGANIYELDKHIHDCIEQDAYRLALAILMPRDNFMARFHVTRSLISQEVDPREVDILTVETLATELIVERAACGSRCKHLRLCDVASHSKPPPGSVIF